MSIRKSKADLNNLIDRKSQQLIEAAHRTGQVDAEPLAELERLTTLAQLYKSSSAYQRVSQVPLLLAVAVTLMIVSFLLFHRISRAEIALDAKVSEVNFLTKDRIPMNRPWSLATVSIEEASEIVVPTPDQPNGSRRLIDDKAYAAFTSAPGRHGPSTIVMSALLLDPGVRVELLRRGSDRVELRLTPTPTKPIVVKFLLKGSLQLAYPETASVVASFELPREVIARAVNGSLIVSFKPSENRLELSENIPIAELILLQDQEYYDPKNSLLRIISSIKQAALFQESLHGQEVKVRDGEEMHFVGLGGFLSSGIELPSDKSNLGSAVIALQFSGSVTGMTMGRGASTRSIMPTTLEWLAKQELVSLFWGTAIYVIGLSYTIWKSLRSDGISVTR